MSTEVKVDDILKAQDVLTWLSDQASSIVDSAQRAEMVGRLALASLYLVEYAAHRTNGMAHAEALQATARGELPLCEPGAQSAYPAQGTQGVES